MAGIFISYRREDSIAYAGRLSDRLHSHFGNRSPVFMDVDTIQPGEDFIERIEQTVGSCDVLIAVIGKQWLSSLNEQGQVRLTDPEDFVHLEIRTALDRKVRVIPALVGGARMPRAQDLPAPLAALARRHAIEISDVTFHESVARLIDALEKVLAQSEEKKTPMESSTVHTTAPVAQKPEPVSVISSAPGAAGEPRAQDRSGFFGSFARRLHSIPRGVFVALVIGMIVGGIGLLQSLGRLRLPSEPKARPTSATKAEHNTPPTGVVSAPSSIPERQPTNSSWIARAPALERTLDHDLVNAVAFSPDSRRLASSGGKMTNLWDAATGTLLHTLGHTDLVYSVAFSPDSRRLASGDKTIKLSDAATGTLLHTLNGHADTVFELAFSPDGRQLASGSSDKTIKLWNPATRTLLYTLNGHAGYVSSVAFSPDSHQLASGSTDKSIKLWDVATGTLLHTLNGHTSDVHSVAFSPDGRQLASGSRDETIKLWNPATQTLLHTLKGHTGFVHSVAFSPDSRQLTSSGQDKTIKLWDAATGTLLHTMNGHTSTVHSVAFSPDGRQLASGSGGDDTIKLWKVHENKR